MIRVNALVFLFLVQFLLILFGLSVVLFRQKKKFIMKDIVSSGEIHRLRDEVENLGQRNEQLAVWKDMFNTLQTKVEQIRSVNAKLKDSIALLVPEAERSKEYEQLISDFEKNNNELDMCIGTLRKENSELDHKTKSFARDIDKLKKKLEQSVSNEEHKNILAQKKSLELKVEGLKEELAQITKEYDNLQKNYVWLEKEYNALYKNTQQEGS